MQWCATENLLSYRLAVAARESIGAAIASGLNSGANISQITFHYENDQESRRGLNDGYISAVCIAVEVEDVDLDTVWRWEDEQEKWLDFLRCVKSAVFSDFETFCSGDRLCGSSLVSLQTISISGKKPYRDSYAIMEPVVDIVRDSTVLLKLAKIHTAYKRLYYASCLKTLFGNLIFRLW